MNGRMIAGAGEKVCHALVAKTAKEITEAAWEIMSSDNVFHKRWPKVGPFVAKHWRDFIGAARASLAVILATPMDPSVEAIMKEPIYEAFLAEGGYKHTPQPVTAADLARTLH